MKTCPKCGGTKNISDFYRNAKRSDGLAGWCIPCENQAGKTSLEKFRLRALTHLGGKCVRCGYATSGPALQIDHVNGDGHIERKAQGAARAVLRAALTDTENRYQLLCANCNIIKRGDRAEHGRRVQPRTIPAVGGTKRCARCTETKAATEFGVNAGRRDGLTTYCLPCTIARTREDEIRLRRAALRLLGMRCASCGYDADERALQIDHVDGDGAAEKQARRVRRVLYLAILAGTHTGRYQILCANCNTIKRVREGEHRPRSSYVHTPATERRQTRKYLTATQVAEVARLVAVEGVPQATVGKLFGISQPTVAVHTRNAYPEYAGRQVRYSTERCHQT